MDHPYVDTPLWAEPDVWMGVSATWDPREGWRIRLSHRHGGDPAVCSHCGVYDHLTTSEALDVLAAELWRPVDGGRTCG